MSDATNLSEDVRELVRAIGDQTRAIGELARAIGATHLDHESRLRKLEEISITLKERMTLWQLAQVGYTTIGTTIASLISFIRRP